MNRSPDERHIKSTLKIMRSFDTHGEEKRVNIWEHIVKIAPCDSLSKNLWGRNGKKEGVERKEKQSYLRFIPGE